MEDAFQCCFHNLCFLYVNPRALGGDFEMRKNPNNCRSIHYGMMESAYHGMSLCRNCLQISILEKNRIGILNGWRCFLGLDKIGKLIFFEEIKLSRHDSELISVYSWFSKLNHNFFISKFNSSSFKILDFLFRWFVDFPFQGCQSYCIHCFFNVQN